MSRVRTPMTFAQGARFIAICLLPLMACSTPPITVIALPVMFLMVRKYLRTRRALRAQWAAIHREVAMARYARAARTWGS